MKQIKVRAIVFDHANCLILDPFKATVEKCKYDASDFISRFTGQDVSPSTLEKTWDYVNRYINYPFCSRFSQEEELIKHLCIELDLYKTMEEVPNELVIGILESYREILKDIIKNNPRTREVREVVRRLKQKGNVLGVFGNDRKKGLEKILNAMEISNFFDYIMSSEELGVEKPDLRVFDHIANYFSNKGISKEEIVYVSNLVEDVNLAKKFGIKSILYKPKEYSTSYVDFNKMEEKPDAIINTVKELLSIVEAPNKY